MTSASPPAATTGGEAVLRRRLATTTLTARLPDAAGRERLEALWAELLVTSAVSEGFADPLGPQLDFRHPTPPEFPGEAVHATERLRIHRSESGFVLGCGDAHLTLELDAQRGYGFLPDSFWREERFDQREFFLLALLMLLRRHGLYGVHGNAVAAPRGGPGDPGVLIVAPSGSGKTTLTLALRRAGWRVLSDDATLLHRNPAAHSGGESVTAHAFRRGFSVAPQTAAAFAELAGAPLLYRVEGKDVLDLEALEPKRHARRTTPRALWFPRIGGGQTTRLEPLEPLAALLALTRQSAGIFVEPAVAQRQLDVMRALVSQAPGATLTLGSDILHDPAGVAARLADAVAESKEPPP